MGLSLKTDNFEEIRTSLISGMNWLRKNSETLESPRHLSLAITGLVVGGDPHKAHHIQRLVSKLRMKQIKERNSKNGSWSGEIYDTAISLLAINKAKLHTEPARKIDYLERGLNFLEKNYEQNSKNWSDYLPETITSCKAILELRDQDQWENLKNSLQWLCSRQCSDDKSFVSTKYTAEIVSLLRLAETEMATDEFDESIEYGIKHIRLAAESDSWSSNPWTLSKIVLAILQVEKLAKIKDSLVKESIGKLLAQQFTNGSWNDSVVTTASCIITLAEMLGYKIINELKIHYWATCRPTSAAFNWEILPSEGNNEEVLHAEGKIIKSQNEGAPIILESFPTEIRRVTVQNMINDKLSAVSNAANDARKRKIRGTQNELTPQNNNKNYVLDTLHRVGDSLYTQLLQRGLHEKKYEVELSKNKVDHITLLANGELSSIPWELIWDGDQFCCLKYSVGRSMGHNDFEQTLSPNEKIKVLLVGDPSGDLNEVENEIRKIKESFDPEWADVDVYSKETFDIEARNFSPTFLDLLRYGNYDIIHYAGHADFSGNRAYLTFQQSNGDYNDRVSAEDVSNYIRRSSTTPKIIFFNACSSAARDSSLNENKLQFDTKFADLATDFVKGFSNIHVPAYIGAIWPIHDTEAAEFAITFYQSIKKGCTIGDSIRLARIESYLKQPENLTWASFILYGDPTTKLQILKEKN